MQLNMNVQCVKANRTDGVQARKIILNTLVYMVNPAFDSAPGSGKPVAMPGRRKNPENRTAREVITDVLRWADMSGFENIAAELRHALSLLRDDQPTKGKRQ